MTDQEQSHYCYKTCYRQNTVQYKCGLWSLRRCTKTRAVSYICNKCCNQYIGESCSIHVTPTSETTTRQNDRTQAPGKTESPTKETTESSNSALLAKTTLENVLSQTSERFTTQSQRTAGQSQGRSMVAVYVTVPIVTVLCLVGLLLLLIILRRKLKCSGKQKANNSGVFSTGNRFTNPSVMNKVYECELIQGTVPGMSTEHNIKDMGHETKIYENSPMEHTTCGEASRKETHRCEGEVGNVYDHTSGGEYNKSFEKNVHGAGHYNALNEHLDVSAYPNGAGVYNSCFDETGTRFDDDYSHANHSTGMDEYSRTGNAGVSKDSTYNNVMS